ncbi:hypothetical protein KP509_05G078800 [Ceratopteris richardii]|uniref:Uncharacterized protein n=1 Tax=Ceratopteris richardii TaxID=49495 RepID=A0A8T2UZY4_CERRI|nr:hypothetical protein KP509_05G078800 [Ceratopteris richardii]
MEAFVRFRMHQIRINLSSLFYPQLTSIFQFKAINHFKSQKAFRSINVDFCYIIAASFSRSYVPVLKDQSAQAIPTCILTCSPLPHSLDVLYLHMDSWRDLTWS